MEAIFAAECTETVQPPQDKVPSQGHTEDEKQGWNCAKPNKNVLYAFRSLKP